MRRLRLGVLGHLGEDNEFGVARRAELANTRSTRHSALARGGCRFGLFDPDVRPAHSARASPTFGDVYSRYASNETWSIVAALLLAGLIGGIASTFAISLLFSINTTTGLIAYHNASVPALSTAAGLAGIVIGVVVSGGLALPPFLRMIAGLTISPVEGVITVFAGRMLSLIINIVIGGGIAGAYALVPLLGFLGLFTTVIVLALEVALVRSFVVSNQPPDPWLDGDDDNLSDSTWLS